MNQAAINKRCIYMQMHKRMKNILTYIIAWHSIMAKKLLARYFYVFTYTVFLILLNHKSLSAVLFLGKKKISIERNDGFCNSGATRWTV